MEPAENTPAESTPAESTPAESTPAESTPAESTPAESTPAESILLEIATELDAAEAPHLLGLSARVRWLKKDRDFLSKARSNACRLLEAIDGSLRNAGAPMEELTTEQGLIWLTRELHAAVAARQAATGQLEARGAQLEERASQLEERASQLATRATQLAARVTQLEESAALLTTRTQHANKGQLAAPAEAMRAKEGAEALRRQCSENVRTICQLTAKIKRLEKVRAPAKKTTRPTAKIRAGKTRTRKRS